MLVKWRFQSNLDNCFCLKMYLPERAYSDSSRKWFEICGFRGIDTEDQMLNWDRHLVFNSIDKPGDNFSKIQRLCIRNFGRSEREPTHDPTRGLALWQHQCCREGAELAPVRKLKIMPTRSKFWNSVPKTLQLAYIRIAFTHWLCAPGAGAHVLSGL